MYQLKPRIALTIGLIVTIGTILMTTSIEPQRYPSNSALIAQDASAIKIGFMEMGGGNMQGSMSGSKNMSGTNQMGNKTSSMNMPAMQDDTANASITKVITRQVQDGNFRSIIFVKYEGKLHINHIVINQTNSHTKILKVSISHNWIPDIEGNSITLHSDMAFIKSHGNKAMFGIKVVTDQEPTFKLHMVGTHSGK